MTRLSIVSDRVVHSHEIQNDVDCESCEDHMLTPKQKSVVSREVEGTIVGAAKTGKCDYHVHKDVPIGNQVVF